MSEQPSRSAQRIWARGFGLALRPLIPVDLEAPGIQRALRDGIERNYEGDLPLPKRGGQCYSIDAGRTLVGVLAFRRDVPHHAAVVFDCVAIAPEHRGSAYAARALLLAERRLRATSYYGRVPRTNGRGLYFMLRCGYAPVAPPVQDGVTWFLRHRPRRAGLLAVSPPAAAPVRPPSASAGIVDS